MLKANVNRFFSSVLSAWQDQTLFLCGIFGVSGNEAGYWTIEHSLPYGGSCNVPLLCHKNKSLLPSAIFRCWATFASLRCGRFTISWVLSILSVLTTYLFFLPIALLGRWYWQGTCIQTAIQDTFISSEPRMNTLSSGWEHIWSSTIHVLYLSLILQNEIAMPILCPLDMNLWWPAHVASICVSFQLAWAMM